MMGVLFVTSFFLAVCCFFPYLSWKSIFKHCEFLISTATAVFWLVKLNTKLLRRGLFFVCEFVDTSPQALARKKQLQNSTPILTPKYFDATNPSLTLLASDFCQSMLFLGKKNIKHKKKRWVCVLHQKNKQTKQKLNIFSPLHPFTAPNLPLSWKPWHRPTRCHGGPVFVMDSLLKWAFSALNFLQSVAFPNVKCLSIILVLIVCY